MDEFNLDYGVEMDLSRKLFSISNDFEYGYSKHTWRSLFYGLLLLWTKIFKRINIGNNLSTSLEHKFKKHINSLWTLKFNTSENYEDREVDINKGFVAIIGESGCGKSTILSILSGLAKLNNEQRKKLYFYRNNVKYSFNDRVKLNSFKKNSFGYIFQRCFESKTLSVLDNISLPMIARKNTSICNVKSASLDLLNIIGLNSLANKFANELSGGQLTRVGVMRGLAQNPEVLFADEPASNLDSENVLNIFQKLKEWQSLKERSVILVTHKVKQAFKVADQLIVVKANNRKESEIVLVEEKFGEEWEENQRERIYKSIKLVNNDMSCKIPEIENQERINIAGFIWFMLKMTFRNIISRADSSLSISVIFLAGMITIISLFLSGSYVSEWYSEINKKKNNSIFLRTIGIDIGLPTGLSNVAQEDLNSTKIKTVKKFIIDQYNESILETKQMAKNNTISENDAYIYIDNLNLISLIDKNIEILEKYQKYIREKIKESFHLNNFDITALKGIEKKIRRVLWLSEIIKEINIAKEENTIGHVYTNYESGPEFVRGDGIRNNQTTNMTWIEYDDPLLNDPRINVIKGKTRPFFNKEQKEGIIIERETFVEELGYDLVNDNQVKVIYGTGEKACVPVVAVIEKWPYKNFRSVVTTIDFGLKIRDRAQQCEDQKHYLGVEIYSDEGNKIPEKCQNFDVAKNKDNFGNKLYKFTYNNKEIKIRALSHKYSKTKNGWIQFIADDLEIQKSQELIKNIKKYEIVRGTGDPPLYREGILYASTSKIVRSLGFYLSEAYPTKSKKWEINPEDNEHKIQYANQSEKIFKTIQSFNEYMFIFLFSLFVVIIMSIDIRRKATEIGIYRVMGLDTLYITFIFFSKTIIIILVASLIVLLLFFPVLIFKIGQNLFIKYVVKGVWKSFEEQNIAIDIVSNVDYWKVLMESIDMVRDIAGITVLVLSLVSIFVFWWIQKRSDKEIIGLLQES